MMLFRKTVMNGLALEECPFQREFELEGCLESNPELLCLDDDDFSSPRLIAVEAFMQNGRGRSGGRADMIVAYSCGRIGIVELKKGSIDRNAYNQLSDYLSARSGLVEVNSFKEYLKSEGQTIEKLKEDDFVGVLVGQEIDEEVLDLIRGAKSNKRIYAIEIRRLKTKEAVFILSNVISQKRRDHTKFRINKEQERYGKGRLVFEVIRRYVESKRGQVSYADLEHVFPAKLKGVKHKGFGCFLWRSEALRQAEQTGYVRHYLKEEEMIHLLDGDVAVSTQWDAKNIRNFIEKAEKVLHIHIHGEAVR